MKRSIIIMSSSLVLLLIFTLFFIPEGLLSAEKESAKKGYLGVSVEPLTRHLKKELKADFGVVITNIEEDSPADKDGLLEDDVIQKVNDSEIRHPGTLTRVIRKIKPGETARVLVIRDGKEKTITVTLGRVKGIRSYSFSVGPNVNVFKWYGRGAYLGINLHELNNDLAAYFGVKEDEGALILDVEEDSPAEKAGLKAGDVLTKIDGETISNPEDVQEIISDLEEDDTVKIEIIRKNQKLTIETKLEEREDHRNFFMWPGRKVEELKSKSNRDNLFDRLLPGIKKPEKPLEIKIEKKKDSLSETI